MNVEADCTDVKKTCFIHPTECSDYPFFVIRLCHLQDCTANRCPSLRGFSHCYFLYPLHKVYCYNTGKVPGSLKLGQLSDSYMSESQVITSLMYIDLGQCNLPGGLCVCACPKVKII